MDTSNVNSDVFHVRMSPLKVFSHLTYLIRIEQSVRASITTGYKLAKCCGERERGEKDEK
jgi:hypothetical protein